MKEVFCSTGMPGIIFSGKERITFPQDLFNEAKYSFKDPEVYDEAIMRLSSPTIQGHFHMVFTATLGLEFWREVIEEKGVKERFPHAWKKQVSAYDCLKYMDGSASPRSMMK